MSTSFHGETSLEPADGDEGGGNGAREVVAALVDSNVEVMFANPGTTEMYLVAALDRVPEMRPVLCQFEGVAAGAADGYARMTGRPAATLLHLGAGFGYAWPNLHNARRGGTPVVNIVGEHATSHLGLQSPLESDLETLAGTVSGWVRRATSANSVATDARAAVAAANALSAGRDVTDPGTTSTGGAVATLIVPADVSWTRRVAPTPTAATSADQISDDNDADPAPAAAAALRSGGQVALILGAGSSSDDDLRAADRLRQATGALVYAETFPTRRRRGVGLPVIADLPFQAEQTRQLLEKVDCAILLDTPEPVAAFAAPGRPGRLLPAQTSIIRVPRHRASSLLAELAAALAPDVRPTAAPRLAAGGDVLSAGALTAKNWGDVFAAALPEDAIISDESITSGMFGLIDAMTHAHPHDTLGQAGYAIGQGIPIATGAAIACPGRPVFNLQADGSAMYTVSGLWTQARENLDVTTIILDNGRYAILDGELERAGGAGLPMAESLINLSRPSLNFVAIARGMGVPGAIASTGIELRAALGRARATDGPFLIHARLSA
jgi:acetolactate synthase I/II/III large subunit